MGQIRPPWILKDLLTDSFGLKILVKGVLVSHSRPYNLQG